MVKYTDNLSKFVKWFGPEKSVHEIDKNVLQNYYDWLSDKTIEHNDEDIRICAEHRKIVVNLKEGERKPRLKRVLGVGFSTDYARDLMGLLRSFLNYLIGHEHIKPLQILNLKTAFRFRKIEKENESIPIQEVHEVLQNEKINDRIKLYVLLAMNCGMTQTDFAKISQDEVDWVEGRIVRKRTKTRKCPNAPIVSYKLWTQTFQLLQKCRAPLDSEFVLLNEDGNTLRKISIDPTTNKISKSCSVSTAWKREMKKHGIQYSIKYFRKTSGNLIANNPDYHHLDELFLGHSRKTVADKHYKFTMKHVLDKALQWLGEQYELDKIMPID